MRSAALLTLALLAATPALAQVRGGPEAHILRNAPATEEEAPATAPPVNLRPTQLLRCPDGKGGILLQDTPCKPPPAPTAATAAAVPEVTDLSVLPPRPQAEAPAPRVDDGAQSRWTRGLINGSWKVALLLLGGYALYRLARYARERFQQRFPPPEVRSHAARRIH
jgi:hypothetical protein